MVATLLEAAGAEASRPEDMDPRDGLKAEGYQLSEVQAQEILAMRLHRLTGATAGQHDQTQAVGGASAKVVQSARYALELGLAEISLTRFFMVARDAFARVALNGVAPWQGFTSLWHQRHREHLRGDAQDAVGADRSA